jgi:Flp pilus assembly protein TadD
MRGRLPYRLAVALGALLLAFPPAWAGDKKEISYAIEIARKGLWLEATHRFRILLEKNPNSGRLWNNYAVACEATGRFHEAHAAYQKATTLGLLDPEFEANRDAFTVFYETWSQQNPRPEPVSSGGAQPGIAG